METKIINEDEYILAVEAMKNDETIAFKTDTIYGLSCLATTSIACQKLTSIKGRENKPLIVLMSRDMDILEYVQEVSPKARKVLEHFWPAPLTVIFRSKYHFCDTITCGNPTIAIRVPNDTLTEKIISALGSPIVSTSANMSGCTPLCTPESIAETFAGKIPYVIKSEVFTQSPSSTILSLVDDDIRVLREGAITKAEIMAFIDNQLK